jgi:hypothetical protein
VAALMGSVKYWGYNIVFGEAMLLMAYLAPNLPLRLLLMVAGWFAFFQAGVISELGKPPVPPPRNLSARDWMWTNGMWTIVYAVLQLGTSVWFGAIVNAAVLTFSSWLWGASWQRYRSEQALKSRTE